MVFPQLYIYAFGQRPFPGTVHTSIFLQKKNRCFPMVFEKKKVTKTYIFSTAVENGTFCEKHLGFQSGT